MKYSRILPFLLLAIAMGALLPGCSTAMFPEYNPAGRVMAGQMLYSDKKRMFIGEFTVRQSPTDFALDVTKGPGMQLILVRENGDRMARVEAMEHSWQGNPHIYVPPPVRHWLEMREVFAGQTPDGATVSREPQKITVQFANGERFVFHING
jgi:hypothetical protein